ncbi:MAG: hypothetical protein NVSMB27_06150 [Ktedonobacteraceae bacterium]
MKTLQKWDREGTFTARRTPTNRRYYTDDDYLAYLKGEKILLLCKKIKLIVSDEDAATLEFMQGKCRGLYNWWVEVTKRCILAGCLRSKEGLTGKQSV